MTVHDEPPYDPDYDGPPAERHLHAVRPEPNDVAAERALLGALILDPTRAPELALEVDRTDFYDFNHQTIWDAAQTITTNLTGDTRLDAKMLADHLTDIRDHRGRTALARIGGAPYLQACVDACLTPGNASYYASRIRDAARLRAIQTLGTRFLQIASTGDLDAIQPAFDTAYTDLDTAAARLGPTTDVPSATGLKDLSWILTGGQAPTQDPPRYTVRTDDHALFYAGKVNGIFGDPEAAKTWLAQTAIVQALNEGGTAAMIDVDHNGMDHTAARLLLLGARLEHLADPQRFRYYEPEDADELRAAVTDITQRRPNVVVIDSLGEVLPMLGVKSTDNDEITTALRTICQPPANAGSCVITIDHLPKSAEARITGYAIGGTAKKRVMRGAYIKAEARVQPAPGQRGLVSLFIEKDTSGELRKVTPGGKYVGTFALDSTIPGITKWDISRDDSPITETGDFRPTHLMEAVSRYVEQNDQCSQRDIRDAVKSSPKNVVAAINCLITDGFLTTVQGKGRAVLHHAVAMYREDEDDQK